MSYHIEAFAKLCQILPDLNIRELDINENTASKSSRYPLYFLTNMKI